MCIILGSYTLRYRPTTRNAQRPSTRKPSDGISASTREWSTIWLEPQRLTRRLRCLQRAGAINGGLTKRNNEVKNTVITVDVTDIEATLKNVEKLGGKMVRKKEPVADMGFTAYFKDTEGNIVGLWQSARRM